MHVLLNRLALAALCALAPIAGAEPATQTVAIAHTPRAIDTTLPETLPVRSPAPAKAAKAAPAKSTQAKTGSSKTTASKSTASKTPSSKPANKTASKSTTKKPAAKKQVAANKKPAPAKKTVAAKKPAAPKVVITDINAFNKAAKAYLIRVQDKDLWAAGDEEQLPPASLTKIMTALLVLENYRPDDVTVIGAAAAAEPRSNIGLRAGDRMYVGDLLAAALIHSANDACHALADYVDGSEEKFVERMNLKAAELGMKNTHFINACGLDAPGHLSTARDIAILADTAMQNPTFARLVRKEQMVIRSADGARKFSFRTTNALVGHYPGMMGGKTGFTNRAGPCLVAMAERDGVRVLLVMLNATNRWWNASGMFDLAFAQAARG